MPEAVLPLFLDGCVPISTMASYEKRDGTVFYFCGSFPIFSHDENDDRCFKLITSQLIDNGLCRNVDIQNAFGVTKVSVARNLKRFREGGSGAFFTARNTRGASVMTPEVLQECQELLDDGVDRGKIANLVGIKKDTLRKAIESGKLHEVKKRPHGI